jgi:hypothetical protein
MIYKLTITEKLELMRCFEKVKHVKELTTHMFSLLANARHPKIQLAKHPLLFYCANWIIP